MQVLVLYHSRTGHTKALASAVADGVRRVDGVDCVLKSVSEVTQDDFVDSDGIVAGSPVYFGSMASELKAVFDRFVPKHARRYGDVGDAIRDAVAAYVRDVRDRRFPTDEHSFCMDEKALTELLTSDDVPEPLVRQLGEGGRMIIPVGSTAQQLLLFRREGGELRREDDIMVRFVPMVKKTE